MRSKRARRDAAAVELRAEHGPEHLIDAAGAENPAIGITIIVLADEAAAPTELPKAVAHLSTETSPDPPQPIAVGDEAFVISGATPDGTRTALLRVGLDAAATP